MTEDEFWSAPAEQSGDGALDCLESRLQAVGDQENAACKAELQTKEVWRTLATVNVSP
jgi:hypothetical protein